MGFTNHFYQRLDSTGIGFYDLQLDKRKRVIVND